MVWLLSFSLICPMMSAKMRPTDSSALSSASSANTCLNFFIMSGYSWLHVFTLSWRGKQNEDTPDIIFTSSRSRSELTSAVTVWPHACSVSSTIHCRTSWKAQHAPGNFMVMFSSASRTICMAVLNFTKHLYGPPRMRALSVQRIRKISTQTCCVRYTTMIQSSYYLRVRISSLQKFADKSRLYCRMNTFSSWLAIRFGMQLAYCCIHRTPSSIRLKLQLISAFAGLSPNC